VREEWEWKLCGKQQNPCSEFLLRKLIVTYKIKKYLSFCGPRIFTTVFKSVRHHWLLSWIRRIESISSQLISMFRFHIILSSVHRCCKLPVQLRFSNYILKASVMFSMHAARRRPSRLPWVHHRIKLITVAARSNAFARSNSRIMHRITGFSNFFHRLVFQRTRRFGNWICFCPQVKVLSDWD
jgi:hypothetical protein